MARLVIRKGSQIRGKLFEALSRRPITNGEEVDFHDSWSSAGRDEDVYRFFVKKRGVEVHPEVEEMDGRQRVFRSGPSTGDTMACAQREAGFATKEGGVGDWRREGLAIGLPMGGRRGTRGPGAQVGAAGMAPPQHHAV